MNGRSLGIGLLVCLTAGAGLASDASPVRESVVAVAAVAAGDVDVDVGRVDALLERAVGASRSLVRAGELVVVTFGDDGPRIDRSEVVLGGDGVRFAREGGTEIGRIEGRGFLRSASTLLQVGGVERVPVQLGRLHGKYTVTLGAAVELDTGPATPIALHERDGAVLRETLYADGATGLIVRRETYGLDGLPRRTVAYTRLEAVEQPPTMPQASGRQVRHHRVTAADAGALRADGFVVPASLPRGYELTTAITIPEAHVPTLHLIYGDGLYTMSVFQQRGRMKAAATDGATGIRTVDGGAVWRWAGSEPRRVVWNGDGATFTALTDMPTDELLATLTGLPTDPPRSTLSRLDRGLRKLLPWMSPSNGSDT